MKLELTNKAEVFEIIRTLKTSKSCGWDGISNNTVKVVASVASQPLAHVIKLLMTIVVFPYKLKYATVRPIYKKGDYSEMQNYRPISVLPIFSKIFESGVQHILAVFSSRRKHLV